MNEPMRSFDDRSLARTAGPARANTSDPLAELARLVGQDDPFRDIFGDATRAASESQSRAAAEPAFDDTSWLEAALRPGYPADDHDPHTAHEHMAHEQMAHEEPLPAFGYVDPRHPAYAESDEPQADITLRKRSGGFLAAGRCSVSR